MLMRRPSKQQIAARIGWLFAELLEEKMEAQ